MRPRTLDEFVGQPALVGSGGPMRRFVALRRLPSMVLWGPPGSGKTTLARLLAEAVGAEFATMSAVLAGVAEVRQIIANAHDRVRFGGPDTSPTVLFIDEIHRFNKAQQDALLPGVEEGLLTLIGATTENPYFEVNSALLSRCQLYRFAPLTDDDVETLVRRALDDREHGLGELGLTLGEGALPFLVEVARGDARVALNALETAVRSRGLRAGSGSAEISVADLQDAAQKKPLSYDREDAHYDTISAFIKSMRGSDPDAVEYYLAAMLAGGEDPKFIARRIIIFASEDVGNADPRALEVAVAAARAVEFVGLPEGRINLSQAALYMALAPKSNAAYKAIDAAMADVEKRGNEPPPPHLRDTNYRGAKELGHGAGYKYPHAFGGWVEQQYLPDALRGASYFTAQRGVELELSRRLADTQRRAGRPAPGDATGAESTPDTDEREG